MRRRALLGLLIAAWLGAGSARCALGQAPTIGTDIPGTPGSTLSSLGPVPGAGAVPFGAMPGSDSMYLSGRPGASTPRVPASITTPGGGIVPLARQRLVPPAPLAVADVPPYGPLEVPPITPSEGPADGLTLDTALELLLANNLYLRSNALQIPKARADSLTASLRANPIFYADSQLIPYGQYSQSKAGGPQQYDVNIQYPLDVSHKRQARMVVAQRAVEISEAQLQDAARLEIDNLYTAFVNVLAARETVRFAEASIEGLEKVIAANEALFRRSNVTRPDVDRVRNLKNRALMGHELARVTLERTKRDLATLLNIPPSEAPRLQLRGRLAAPGPELPPLDELVRIALADRPDLVAQRLGVVRADAEVALARANRFADVYVLYQPYTFQNLAPFGQQSATSYAFGATVPIPIFNRNQGGVLRSRLAFDQSQVQVAALERQVAAEVVDAHRQYTVTRAALAKLEHEVLPTARQHRDDTLRLFVRGDSDARASYTAQKDYNEVVRVYRDAAVRHRRSMLKLNTAVGRRVLP